MVSNLQNQDIALVITTECNYENAEKLAEIQNVSFELIAKKTTENINNLFSI